MLPNNDEQSTQQVIQQLYQECAFLLALHQLEVTLHQNLDFEQVLENILYGMINLIHAEDGYLFVSDEQNTPLHWVTSHERIPLTPELIKTVLHEGPEGIALQEREMLILPNERAYPDHPFSSDHAMMIMPFFTTIGISGVLVLLQKLSQPFDAQQEKFFSLAAETIGFAIQNAQIRQQFQETESARERMINRLVHDIRSPLMATSASMDVIKRILSTIQLEPNMQKFIQDSVESGKRGLQEAISLTNDLLDLKKIQSGRYILDYRTIMIEFLFDDIHKLFYSLAIQKQVILRYQVLPRTLKVEADTRLLQRSIVNLVSNALRFSPEGGVITLEASCSSANNSVVIIVEDMGPGIHPADRQRIFTPFVQAEGESNNGTGLGLAFCREVALAHGGHIWIEDRPGGGSRFCLSIPTKTS